MRRFAPLLKTRLARGTLVNVYALVVQLVSQILMVPLLARVWGEEVLGYWLMLNAIPIAFNLSDLGLGSAASTVMTSLTARGEFGEADKVYVALRRFTAAIAAGVAVAAAAIAYASMPPFMRASTDWLVALMCVTAFGYLTIFNSVSMAAFQAADRYAQGMVILNSTMLLECLGALVCAFLGGSPGMVAAVYLAIRLASAMLKLAILRWSVGWLGRASWAESRAQLRPLVRPAMAAMLFPIGNAISIQGASLALGSIAGAAAVPAFVISRTLCRLGAQFAFLISRASMPRYTVAHSSGDMVKTRDLMALNIASSLLTAIPAAVLLAVIGPWFIGLWTGGEIRPAPTLVAILATAMVFNAMWIPVANLMLSINRHERFTLAYVAAAALALPVGLSLPGRDPAEGMALALALMEVFMVVWVVRGATQMGALSAAGLRASAERLHAALRPPPA